MAPQPVAPVLTSALATAVASSSPSGQDFSWRSYHLYYHGDRNRILLHFVTPIVRNLLLERRIESFFFIRYALGGPHIRLRLRTQPDLAAEVDEMVLGGAAEFFSRWPSREELSPDPARYGPSLEPNNSAAIALFDPETERYGGPERIGDSLDFFAISSLEALRFITAHGSELWARQLPVIFCLLLSQALGASHCENELWPTLDYMSTFRDARAERIAGRAERVLSENREIFFQLFRNEVNRQLDSGPTGLAKAACLFSNRIAALDQPAYRLIQASQMHMTANRLGLKNSEEIYLGLLMKRTGQELWEIDLDFRNLLRRSLAYSANAAGDVGLTELAADRLRFF